MRSMKGIRSNPGRQAPSRAAGPPSLVLCATLALVVAGVAPRAGAEGPTRSVAVGKATIHFYLEPEPPTPATLELLERFRAVTEARLRGEEPPEPAPQSAEPDRAGLTRTWARPPIDLVPTMYVDSGGAPYCAEGAPPVRSTSSEAGAD